MSPSRIVNTINVHLLLIFALCMNPAFAESQDESTETDVQGKEVPPSTEGEEDAAGMAQKLANPLAALISLPMQFNYDQDYGVADTGDKLTLNVQPVIPISLNEDWNLISRTVLPVVSQDNVVPGTGSQFGLADTVQSLWFSPVKPTKGGLIWGVGPAILLPTATDDLLGADQWGLGPTVVGLVQKGPWTYGGLANHIWSVGGSSSDTDINNTFVQPFLTYNTTTAVTIALNSESNYNWETSQWSIPINFMVSKLKRFNNQMVSFQGGVRYWVETPDSGPEGWGLRASVTFLFPK